MKKHKKKADDPTTKSSTSTFPQPLSGSLISYQIQSLKSMLSNRQCVFYSDFRAFFYPLNWRKETFDSVINHGVFTGFIKHPIKLKEKNGKPFLQNELKVERPFKGDNSSKKYDIMPFRIAGKGAVRFAELYRQVEQFNDVVTLEGRLTTVDEITKVNVLDVSDFCIPRGYKD